MAKTPRTLQNSRTVNSSVTLNAATDSNVDANAATSAFTITLPSPSSCFGSILNIQKSDTTSNVVNIKSANSEAIGLRNQISLWMYGDFVKVQSNGVTWEVLTKKETEYLSNFTTADYYFSSATSSAYNAITGNSLTLSPGHWKLSCTLTQYDGGGGSNNYASSLSGWFAANGANTGSAPAQITLPTTGALNLNNISNSNLLVGYGTGHEAVAFTHPPVTIVVPTGGTTIYYVPYMVVGTAADARLRVFVTAERIS